MKISELLGFALLAISLGLSGCGDIETPVEPTPDPTPEEVKSEITIDADIITNGLSFTSAKGEKSLSFTTNEDWTLSIAATPSGDAWCTASATSGAKGNANVIFTVTENTSYDDRSVSVTIKSGTASKTFTITQKYADALLLTSNKYELSQEGGTIEIEVKANINYEMEIAESATDWITETSTRALTACKHTFEIALNEDSEKREGEIHFKSGDKVETVKVYQAGSALILLSKNEYNVSANGETISVDIRSNIEYSVQMPDVDWITEVVTRGMSSHSLQYNISPNDGYDSRSAEITFYDKNSDLKETLKVEQAQKDAIIISGKSITVEQEGGIVEVKVNANIDFDVQIPSEVSWISIANTRALTETSVYLAISENTADEERSATITVINSDTQLYDNVTITQAKTVQAGYENGTVTLAKAGTMKTLLGADYLNINSLKIVGPINGDDVYYLRKMLGAKNSFSEADWGKLTTLDLSEAKIVEGGDYYYYYQDWDGDEYFYYSSNNSIGEYMFSGCNNLQNVVLPANVISIQNRAFSYSSNLISATLPAGVTSIGDWAFEGCSSLTSIDIPDSVTLLGQGAFSECTSLLSVKLGQGMIELGSPWDTFNEGVFFECQALTTIEIPDNITSIGGYAFCYCTSLENIKIGKGVTFIGQQAFQYCNMTSIEIPDNVTTIESYAFVECVNLAHVTIGKNVTSMGYGVFDRSSSITTVYCYAQNPPESYDTYSLFYCPDATLYVPERCGAKYKPVWGKYFKAIIEME